jgi:SPP1 family predicted phage head-tail adaptor
MMAAGQYKDRLTWLKRTVTKNPNNGQDEETFTVNGSLWGSVEPTTGRKAIDYGAEQTGADATIRLRNYPTVSALDRLELPAEGELWVIDHVRRGDNELVCEVVKYDDLNLGGT